ncbi:MAG: CRTAC1 family protein [Elusimicrobia bacterium]|nr:CRTAC1 family protein [Elusimicrobiota bacterium]
MKAASRGTFLIGPALVALAFGGGVWKQSLKTGAAWDSEAHAHLAPAPLPFRLSEISAQSGLVNTHQKLKPHPSFANVEVNSLGAAASVAVVDVDKDGWQDVYVTNSAIGSQNKLFRNNRDGTFTDIAETLGVADVNKTAGSYRALFFDFDNDGRKDLLLTTSRCPVLLHNEGARFRDVTAGSKFACGEATASNVLDADGDGFLDVVIGYVHARDIDLQNPDTHNVMNHNFATARLDPGRILVYKNDRGRAFAPFPGNLGITDEQGHPLAIGVYDLRGTGRPDIHVAMDASYDKLYFNEGGGRFVDATESVRQHYSLSGMSSEMATLDGLPSIFVTNIFEAGQSVVGNILWRPSGPGKYRDAADDWGARRCGWAWGAKFVDLDNDGRMDLVVTNGQLSGNPKKEYWYKRAVMSQAPPEVQWDSRNWPAVGDSSISGHQKKCVYYNIGGRFVDVAKAAGLSDRLDGRGLAYIDFKNDGSHGLIEATRASALQFYANEQRNKNRWIGLDLVARGGREALGAKAKALLKDGRTLERQLQPANGYLSQSDGRIHFGLGAAAELESIELRWPSGAVQKLQGLTTNRYHRIVEGIPRGK